MQFLVKHLGDDGWIEGYIGWVCDRMLRTTTTRISCKSCNNKDGCGRGEFNDIGLDQTLSPC